MKPSNSFAAVPFLALFFSSTLAGEHGVVIYTEIDHGEDRIAKAVPFVKAEQFPLVTNITTREGATFRITNNRLKAIVRPPDLALATVIGDTELQKLRTEAGAIRSMQERYPRTKTALDPLAAEIERMVQALENGNVLIQGRLIPKIDYQRQLAAPVPQANDLIIDGKEYRGAKITSISIDRVSITHSGGVASIEVAKLSDEQIAILNQTSNTLSIDKAEMAAVRKESDRKIAEAEAAREEAARQERLKIMSENEMLRKENNYLRNQTSVNQGAGGVIQSHHFRNAVILANETAKQTFWAAQSRRKASEQWAAEGRFLDPSPTTEELILECKQYLQGVQSDLAKLRLLLEDKLTGLKGPFGAGIQSLRACGLSEANAELCFTAATLMAAQKLADQDAK